ncbi:aldo/keto reductase [Thermasporomyces composti]|uniref:Aryl-alcohol dehydrogenase-like predicted oxidoreductase n=1 Tax=Thermasporomyces composti TaxID=696763 RepID=A0A3D9V3T1_THECX|nr:aldo/keto reductase [Thermasporomyces composti]REF36139.1 aryl-alcohol dehydrogenase-like predicted oxidoreductase [Thermasporomyces composti]
MQEWNPTRRQLMKAGGLGAAAAVVPSMLAGEAAASSAPSEPKDLITRVIPATGERVPAIGLGSFMTFDTLSDRGRGRIRKVARDFWRAGGRVFDVSPLYGRSEINLGDFITEMRISDRAFLANKVWSTGEYLWDDSHAESNLRRSMQRLSRRRPIDLMQCHSLTNVDVIVPLLHAWKKEGRVRLIGVTHHEPAYFDLLADWVRRGNVDFVQVHYSIHTRVAEEKVLPAARETGTAVLVNMPLEKARLHAVVGNRPVPDFAREFGIETWSQYFLKWVISNPDVTCAIPATSNPKHLAENVAAMRGPLPDPDTRERMYRYVAKIPGFDQIASMPWYPGKSYKGWVTRAQKAIDARSPWPS